MIADRQPVGWRPAVFCALALIVLSQVLISVPLAVFGPAKAPFARHEKDSGLLAAPGAKPVRSVARSA